MLVGIDTEFLIDVHPDRQRRIGVHLGCHLLRGLAGQPHLDVGAHQLGLLRRRMPAQLLAFHLDLGAHLVILGLDRRIFSECHRERARHQPRHPGQHDQMTARTTAAHACDQGHVGHQTIHRAEYGRSEPSSGYVLVDVPDLVSRLDIHD